jgi:hypothetical protein
MLFSSRLWEFLLPVTLLCGEQLAAAEPGSVAPEKPGLVLIVGGVGGLENLKLSLQWALKYAGLDCEIRNFEWTHGKGHIFKDLQDSRNHSQKTTELAEEINRIKAADPDRPLFLIGRSGGAVMALAVSELLPPQTIERIILLSPAVSPNFDLRPALRATRNEIVSFYSDLDWFILGWGTNHFGTADRIYSPSAGMTGFVKPGDDDPEGKELYRRLVQVRWNPAMILVGHTGGHIGTTMPGFLAKDVVPWLKP